MIDEYTEKIYNHSPVAIQNIGISIMRMNLPIQRHMNPFFRNYLKSLLVSQWYSKKELENLQNKLLRSIVRYAYTNVPYYHSVFRSMKIYPDDIKTRGDLKKLPIINKEKIKNHWNQFISKNLHSWQKIKIRTHGSTGYPLDIVWDRKAIIREQCYGYRMRERAHVKISSKLAHFGSMYDFFSEVKNRPPFWRISYPEHIVYFSPYNYSDKNLSLYIKKLQRYNPEIIRGHPSKIFLLAWYMEKENLSGVNPKAIFTSSEMLLPNHAKMIRDVFDCNIFDHYGNNEYVSSISQCEEGRYHIDSEYGLIEFMKNGDQVSIGETGEMICTGFINYAMPLIRYNIEDLAVPIDEVCTCGRKLPVVKSIKGRTRDIMVTHDNRYLTIGDVFGGIEEIESIVEYQAIQKSKTDYVFNIVVQSDAFVDRDLITFKNLVKSKIGEGNITVNIVDSIIKPDSKFRVVTSELKHDWN